MEKANFSKRVYERHCFVAPISVANFNTNRFEEATIDNISEGGMLIKTKRFFVPKADICIKVANDACQISELELYKFYRANVRWCKSVPSEETYEAGVKYLVRSQCDCGPKYHCAICEVQIPLGELYEADSYTYLCPACLEEFDSIPSHGIRDIIRNYMSGNVI